MNWDSDGVVKSVKSVDGTGYVDIVTEVHKNAGINTSDWSMAKVTR